jgi:hypothetical protein
VLIEYGRYGIFEEGPAKAELTRQMQRDLVAELREEAERQATRGKRVRLAFEVQGAFARHFKKLGLVRDEGLSHGDTSVFIVDVEEYARALGVGS